MRMANGSAYCGMNRTWQRRSPRTSRTNSEKLPAFVRFTTALGSAPWRSPPPIAI